MDYKVLIIDETSPIYAHESDFEGAKEKKEMKNNKHTAVSFLYEGERHVVKCTTIGKFRVPVTKLLMVDWN